MSRWKAAREAFEQRARSLARDAPILWRTRLPLILAVVLVVDVMLVVAALVWPVDSRAPSIDTIQSIVVNTLALLLALIGIWLGYELRRGLGAWSWRRRIRFGICYALGVVAILTTPLVFLVPWLGRLADTVSDEQLAADQAFHSTFGYWECHAPGVTAEVVAIHQAEILNAVDRYLWRHVVQAELRSAEDHFFGLSWPCRDSRPAVFVKFGASNPPRTDAAIALRAPMESLGAAKDLQRGRGPYATFSFGYLLAALALSLLLPSFLLWLDAGRQREGPWPLATVRVPSVSTLLGWYHLDRFLVARRPLLWSSRLHAIPPATLLGSVLVVPLVVILLHFVEPGASFGSAMVEAWDSDEAWASSLISACAIGIAGLWWRGQRGLRWAMRSTGSALVQFILIIASLSSVLPIVAAVVLIFEPHALDELTLALDDGASASTWIFLSLMPILWLVGFFVLKRSIGWIGTWLGLGSVVLSAFLFSMAVGDSNGLYHWPLFASWLGAGLYLLVSSPHRKLVGPCSAFLLATAPIIGFSVLDASNQGGFLWMFDHRAGWWIIGAILLFFVLAMAIVSRPLRVCSALPKP